MNHPAQAIRILAASGILRQAGWLATAKLVQGACSVLVTFLVARHLGPIQFGELSLSIAAASMIAAAGALGLEQIATREIAGAADHPGEVLAVLHRLRIAGALSGCVVLAAAALVPTLHPEGTAELFLILSLLPLAQAGDISEWRLVADERSKLVAVIVLLTAPSAALVRLALVLAGAGVAAFAWALVAEWGFRSMLLAYATRDASKHPTTSPVDFSRRAASLLRDSMPFLMAGLAVFVYMRIDQFMIAEFLGPEQVGHYSAAVTLAEAPLVLPVLILRAALPRLARQAISDQRQCNSTLVRLMRHTFYLHLAGAVVVAMLAGPIIHLLYGEAYAPAASVLRIQALGAPFVALGVISGAWIVLQKNTNYALWRTLVGAVVNIILNLVMIPAFGIVGAAAATLIAFLTTALVTDAVMPATRPLLRLKLQALGLRTESSS